METEAKKICYATQSITALRA